LKFEAGLPMDDINEGYRSHTDEELKGFRLWYEFLKLSDKALWSSDVIHYFGDLSTDFECWWQEHDYLFDILALPTIDEVITTEDFESYSDARPSEGDSGIVVLAVWMNKSKKELRDAFEEILSKYHFGGAGKPEFETYGDFFQFAARPDAELLEKILTVYKVYVKDQKKPEKDRMKLWQIEEEASKVKQLIDKASKSAEYIWKVKDVDSSVIESRRRSQHTTVRKYLNYAEEILQNVVVGKFPVYNVKKSKGT
jgi:hypothetical protein